MDVNLEKSWECKVGGKSMRLNDLPVGVLEGIRKAANLDSWFELVASPAASLVAGPMLVQACADALGVECPEDMTVRRFIECFDFTEEDLPHAFNGDGSPTRGDASSMVGSSSS